MTEIKYIVEPESFLNWWLNLGQRGYCLYSLSKEGCILYLKGCTSLGLGLEEAGGWTSVELALAQRDEQETQGTCCHTQPQQTSLISHDMLGCRAKRAPSPTRCTPKPLPGRAGDCDEPICSPCSPKTCCRPPLPTYLSSSSLSSGLRPSRPASRLLQHFSFLIIVSPLCSHSSSRASYLWLLSAAPWPGRPFLHPIHPVHSYLRFKTRLQ